MLRAHELGRMGEVFVMVESAQACEKQALTMAWQLFLLLLCHYHKICYERGLYDTQEPDTSTSDNLVDLTANILIPISDYLPGKSLFTSTPN